MDPLSQALFGASAALLASRRAHRKAALVGGAVGGMLPDLDVFIRSSADPLMAIQFHRHFTHCLAFIPAGGLLAALLCWPVFRRTRFALLYLFATLGYATHGLVDAMTSYGTHLLWPFSMERTSWNIVSVIDPVVTLTLLLFILLTLRKRTLAPLLCGLALTAAYLGFGALQQHRAHDAVAALAASRGHEAVQVTARPSLGNLFAWRGLYMAEERIFVDGIHVGVSGHTRVYTGGSLKLVDVETAFPALPADSLQRQDMRRFAFFSDGYVAFKPDDSGVISDMRFSMLPHTLAPLWGIRIDPLAPDAHVPFENYRVRKPGDIAALWAVITGRDLPAE